jgi:peptide/nickel transport system substrate-binding protein
MSLFNKLGQVDLNAVTTSSLSRRSFMRRAAAVGLATPAIAGLLAACGDDDDAADDAADVADPGTDTDDAADDAEEPVDEEDDSAEDADTGDAQRGGTLRIAISGSAENFDPHHQTTFDSIWANGMMYNRLVRVDSEMQPVPDLAHSWEQNEDATEWIFQLHEGVMFHNGREMTAEDVVDSFNRLMDPDEGTAFAQQLEMIDSVEATGDYEVVFNMDGSYADLLTVLGFYAFRVVAVEEADSLATEPVGTGPYRLQSHSPDERTVLERFDDYFLSDEEGFLDEIHFIKIEEETSRLTALTDGTVDMVNEVSPASLPMIEGVPEIEMEEIVTGSYHIFAMQADEEPFTDVNVRRAFKLVANRSEFVQTVLQGYGVEAADQPIPPNDPMYGGIDIPERDIEEARRLLEEAGYPDGLQIELHTTAGRVGLHEAGLTFQSQAAEAGIEVDVINHPVDAYWADIWMQRPFHMSNWGQRPNADLAFTVAYVEGASWNESNWTNEEFEELLAEARGILDEDERREVYREAQQILSDEGAAFIPYFMSVIGAWRQSVHGYEMNPTRMVELHKVWIDDSM